MQLYPILLVAIVLAADGGLRLGAPGSDGMDGASAVLATAFAWSAPLMVLLGTWLGVAICRQRIDRRGATRLILAAERLVRAARWLLLGAHAAAVLALGWLDTARLLVGDLVLVDELITLLPPVLGLLGTWWVIYPIERRLREALLVRRLDLGQPVHPMPSRGRFVLAQMRVGLLLVLVPILLIVALSEVIHLVGERWLGWSPTSGVLEATTFLAAISVFIFAPLLARFVLTVRPMPDGPLREELLEVCRRHGVRVREILFWDTSSSMINAAVMGLIGRLRYVLVTDALLETMDLEQLRAVMAHEVGHVRRHHMPWLVLALFAVIVASVFVIELPLIGLHWMGFSPGRWAAEWTVAIVTLIQLGIALLAFGWISRRFERQADTFAVQHLSGLGLPPGANGGGAVGDGDGDRDTVEGSQRRADSEASGGVSGGYSGSGGEGVRIQPQAVGAMQRALETIAELNAIDPDRPSWRHGSIRWRQTYLASLIGRPARRLPIDRQVRRIKLAAALVLIIGLAGWLLLYAMTPEEMVAGSDDAARRGTVMQSAASMRTMSHSDRAAARENVTP